MPATTGSGERPAERGNPACALGRSRFVNARLPANGSSRGDDGIRLCGANRRDGGGAPVRTGSKGRARTRRHGISVFAIRAGFGAEVAGMAAKSRIGLALSARGMSTWPRDIGCATEPDAPTRKASPLILASRWPCRLCVRSGPSGPRKRLSCRCPDTRLLRSRSGCRRREKFPARRND